MPATGFTHPLLSELAHRVSSGTDVTLSWNERTGAPAVSVRNRGTGALVRFAAAPGKALHAFYRPWAYAVPQGPYRAGAPPAPSA